jgi:hypothetical protein
MDKLAPNSLAVTILPDGRIRLETGSFAGAQHTSADAFVRALLQELGVSIESREAIGHVHSHAHSHEHVAAKPGGGR